MACSFKRCSVEQLCERTTGFEPATSTLARWCSSQLSYVRKSRQPKLSVRDTGIEPVTSSVSGKRATAAPIALEAPNLPKGFDAVKRADDGIRTRDIHLGKVVL